MTINQLNGLPRLAATPGRLPRVSDIRNASDPADLSGLKVPVYWAGEAMPAKENYLATQASQGFAQSADPSLDPILMNSSAGSDLAGQPSLGQASSYPYIPPGSWPVAGTLYRMPMSVRIVLLTPNFVDFDPSTIDPRDTNSFNWTASPSALADLKAAIDDLESAHPNLFVSAGYPIGSSTHYAGIAASMVPRAEHVASGFLGTDATTIALLGDGGEYPAYSHGADSYNAGLYNGAVASATGWDAVAAVAPSFRRLDATLFAMPVNVSGCPFNPDGSVGPRATVRMLNAGWPAAVSAMAANSGCSYGGVLDMQGAWLDGLRSAILARFGLG